MAAPKTSRGRCQRWFTNHRGLKEDPPGSNWDNRKDGIRAAIQRCGFNFPIPWCGAWLFNGYKAAGVKGISKSMALVKWNVNTARARQAPYGRGWVTPRQKDWHKRVLRCDAVVLFGEDVHIAAVRSTAWAYRKLGYIRTDEGNTSAGNTGSQSNGGMSTTRMRRISDIVGFCLADFPDN